MTEKKNGGTAFPRNGHPDKGDYPLNGMSLRDYFAAKAMQGLLSNFDLSKDIILNGKTVSVAQLSYMYSDAMLEAREE